jgi:hypothetical protein
LFGAIASSQQAIECLLKSKLPLFHRLHVENVDFLDPLMWWVANESRFPNVGFLAQHILGIPSSHIEIK